MKLADEEEAEFLQIVRQLGRNCAAYPGEAMFQAMLLLIRYARESDASGSLWVYLSASLIGPWLGSLIPREAVRQRITGGSGLYCLS